MKTIVIEIKWAFIFIGMSFIWIFLERLLGLHGPHIDRQGLYSNFMVIPATAIYALALLDKGRNFYKGVMSYYQGFNSGLIMTVIITFLSPLTQYISAMIIAPEFLHNAIKYTVEKGQLTQQAAENYFSLKHYVEQGFASALMMGLLTSSIVAFYTKQPSMLWK